MRNHFKSNIPPVNSLPACFLLSEALMGRETFPMNFMLKIQDKKLRNPIKVGAGESALKLMCIISYLYIELANDLPSERFSMVQNPRVAR